MDTNNLLDGELIQAQTFSKKRTRQIFLALLALMIVNVVLYYLTPATTKVITNLDGTIAEPEEIRNSAFRAILVGVPILSFILSLMLSLLPYRNMSYKGKYLRFALVTMLILNVLIFVSILLKFIR